MSKVASTGARLNSFYKYFTLLCVFPDNSLLEYLLLGVRPSGWNERAVYIFPLNDQPSQVEDRGLNDNGPEDLQRFYGKGERV